MVEALHGVIGDSRHLRPRLAELSIYRLTPMRVARRRRFRLALMQNVRPDAILET